MTQDARKIQPHEARVAPVSHGIEKEDRKDREMEFHGGNACCGIFEENRWVEK